MSIHKTAEIDSSSEISDTAIIEAGVYIGKGCKIGDNVWIGRNSYIDKYTEIGEGTKVYPHSHLGADPQDYSYKGEDTKLKIGKNCIIREYAPIHRGTTKESWETVLGDNIFIMALTHLGHDCIVGDDVILSTGAMVGGHSHIDKGAIIGGCAALHQFVSVGSYSMVGGASAVRMDIPPYVLVSGNDLEIQGLNVVGLKRRDVKPPVRAEIKSAVGILMDTSLSKNDVVDKLCNLVQYEEIVIFRDFIINSKRPLLRK